MKPTSPPRTEPDQDPGGEARLGAAASGRTGPLFDPETLVPLHEEPLAQAPPAVALDDAARKRRAKALACVAPIVLLEENKARRGFQDYDLQELALAAIETVVDAMTFEGGATSEEVLRALLPLVAAQQWERSEEEHRRVAEAVIETLIAPYSGAYGDYRAGDDVEAKRSRKGD